MLPGDRTRGECALKGPVSLTILLAWPSLGLAWTPPPIPNPTAFPPRSDEPAVTAAGLLPLILLGETLERDTGVLFGLSVRAVRMNGRVVVSAFRSPSLPEASATLTCGGRTRGAGADVSDLAVGARFEAVEGVALAASRGASGVVRGVRAEASVGLRGGGGRPWTLRSDDIPGRKGYRNGYIGIDCGPVRDSNCLELWSSASQRGGFRGGGRV